MSTWVHFVPLHGCWHTKMELFELYPHKYPAADGDVFTREPGMFAHFWAEDIWVEATVFIDCVFASNAD